MIDDPRELDRAPVKRSNEDWRVISVLKNASDQTVYAVLQVLPDGQPWVIALWRPDEAQGKMMVGAHHTNCQDLTLHERPGVGLYLVFNLAVSIAAQVNHLPLQQREMTDMYEQDLIDRALSVGEIAPSTSEELARLVMGAELAAHACFCTQAIGGYDLTPELVRWYEYNTKKLLPHGFTLPPRVTEIVDFWRSRTADYIPHPGELAAQERATSFLLKVRLVLSHVRI